MKTYFCISLFSAFLFFNSCKKDSTKSVAVTVSTLAGSGIAESSDGTGAQASFRYIQGIAVDAAGNLYVTDDADSGLGEVRKITPSGVVTTLPDNASESTNPNDLPATIYSDPQGIARDATGNLYVSYLAQGIIRKIFSSGASEVIFNKIIPQPDGLALDTFGNLYVAGYAANLIIKISSTGLVTTLAGSFTQGNTDGVGATASFNSPTGVAVDKDGNVYVADSGNNEIRKITTTGNVTTIAGNGSEGSSNGLGTSASFEYPSAVAVDGSGNVYVADTNNNLIRKINSSGMVTTLAGTGKIGFVNGPAANASFEYPVALTIAPDGNLYVVDGGNSAVRKITLN